MSNQTILRSTDEDSTYVRNKLIEFNANQLSDDIKNNYEEINLHMKDAEGNIIGGLLSVLCWNWLEVDILWIDQNHRENGHGSSLLSEIERIAWEKKCSFIKLNTFSFQAPDFYKKHGYKIIATINDAPRGHKHYYFLKELD
ncbi:GNAT family N-acetyltransferase [Paenibacillus sp. PDC88]|uniref:GNAT family N-acetyltransferase n=1 Tax=Paenibacillus sp. PDC88 TaxID=1884375 RepID=UPI00089CA3D9|nr:GNAT family N-acetyltransferase [Paenibacillus sp. PDC88]SDW37501.1 Acetyltransferase (GNAT) family protein [Paenibacillus sp. PDC88]